MGAAEAGWSTAGRVFELAGGAATGREALTGVQRLEPDVVLMDLQMPEMDGIASTARIVTEHPDVRVLVLATYDATHRGRASIGAGGPATCQRTHPGRSSSPGSAA